MKLKQANRKQLASAKRPRTAGSVAPRAMQSLKERGAKLLYALTKATDQKEKDKLAKELDDVLMRG